MFGVSACGSSLCCCRRKLPSNASIKGLMLQIRLSGWLRSYKYKTFDALINPVNVIRLICEVYINIVACHIYVIVAEELIELIDACACFRCDSEFTFLKLRHSFWVRIRCANMPSFEFASNSSLFQKVQGRNLSSKRIWCPIRQRKCIAKCSINCRIIIYLFALSLFLSSTPLASNEQSTD